MSGNWDNVAGERNTPAGAALLTAVETFIGRFVAFPTEHTRTAATLWAAHTHALDAFESSPRLAPLSPEPGSGKTRLLEVLELLVPRPLMTVNASSAALFRKVSDPDGAPTLLLDEADTVFGPRASKDHEDLRGFVNAGHRRGAIALRCVVHGKNVSVEELPAYAAVAVAGLDDLPDTIMSRSVVIRMRRRAPGEKVEPYRPRLHSAEGEKLRGQLGEWVDAVRPALSDSWPEMPGEVQDRSADVWEPLVAVADQAGGDWPARARVAAVALVAANQEGQRESLGVRLLADLRTVFGDADRLPTGVILDRLHDLDEAPWGDLRGKPLDSRGLARRLARYEIAPKQVRVGDRNVRGYQRSDCLDAFGRYLTRSDPYTPPRYTDREKESEKGDAEGPWSPPTSATPATPLQPASLYDLFDDQLPVQPVDGPINRSSIGPCLGCQTPITRYGDHGVPYCPDCQARISA